MTPARALAALLLVACGSPSPDDQVRSALIASGASFDEAGLARWSEPDTPVEITRHATPCRVIVKTRGWAGLDEAAGAAGVARLLTEIAARNAETPGVRVGLNASTGDVEADITLWCEGGMADDAVRDAINDLHTAVRDMRTPLRKAATLAPL